MREKLEQFRKHRKRTEAKCATMSRYFHDRHADGPRTFAVSRKVLRLRFAWDNLAKTQETSGHNTVHTFHITVTCTTPIPVISHDDDATRCPARPIGFPHVASCTRGEELLLRSLSSTSARSARTDVAQPWSRFGELKLGSGIIFTHHNSRCLDFAKGTR